MRSSGGDFSYPPLGGGGGGGEEGGGGGGVTVSRLEQCAGGETVTPPRLAFRFALCEPTLPLQGRVRELQMRPMMRERLDFFLAQWERDIGHGRHGAAGAG